MSFSLPKEKKVAELSNNPTFDLNFIHSQSNTHTEPDYDPFYEKLKKRNKSFALNLKRNRPGLLRISRTQKTQEDVYDTPKVHQSLPKLANRYTSKNKQQQTILPMKKSNIFKTTEYEKMLQAKFQQLREMRSPQNYTFRLGNHEQNSSSLLINIKKYGNWNLQKI